MDKVDKQWVHCILTTQANKMLINDGISKQVYNLIGQELNNRSCAVRIINGMQNHVHILMCINVSIDINAIINEVKNKVILFIENSQLISQEFSWEDDNVIYPITDDMLEEEIAFIRKQKDYHRYISLANELKALNKNHLVN